MTTTTLSKPRLERLHHALSGYIHRGDMPGLVALVSCRGDVHIETLGTMRVGHPVLMKRDTIFRIASLTKPITAVAAMILIEECKLRLGRRAWHIRIHRSCGRSDRHPVHPTNDGFAATAPHVQ